MRIINSIRTVIIYKFLNRLKRPSRGIKTISTKNDLKLASKSVSTRPTTARQIFQRINIRRIILVVFVTVTASIFVLHVHIYNQFSTKELFPGENYPVVNYQSNTKDLNLLFIGYSELPNGEMSIGLTSLATIDFQTGRINIYTINTNIRTNITKDGITQIIPIRDFFNQFTLAEGKKLMLIDAIEVMLGLKVDNYIAFNIDTYYEDFTKIGFNLSELEGKYISTDLVKNNTMIEQDAVTSNQAIFIKLYFEQLTIFKLYHIFLNSFHLVDTLYTDLEKNEFLSNMYNIAILDKRILNLSSVGKLVTKDDASVIVNQTLLYENVRDLNQKIQVITEQAEIEIFNGSGKAGLAARKRRELEQLGINIVRFGNYPEFVQGNILYIPDGNVQRFTNTITEIERNLEGKLIINTDEYEGNYTGNMILVLGEEITN